MNLMDDDNGHTSFWKPTNILGGFLVIVGAGVLLWVVSSLFQLFSNSSSFLVLNQIIPKEVVISQSTDGAKLLLPRELLIFGIPIWALSMAINIGLALLKNGLEYVEKPKKRAE